jgi:hypothetical protein
VSVPEGAPPPSKDHKPEERSGSDEAGKFKFMWNNRERLKRIRRFVLAVDDDAPGKRLADELIRRLLASRCLMVKYPEACKKSPAGTATFCGADIMDDPAFDGDQPLTIVEGEIDKLALETAGNPLSSACQMVRHRHRQITSETKRRAVASGSVGAVGVTARKCSDCTTSGTLPELRPPVGIAVAAVV